MEIERLEILRGIAEMAYVIAKADRGLSAPERIAFNRIIEEELHLDSWAAQSRFEIMDEVTEPSIDKAYNEAMRDFRKYKNHLTPELKEKTIRVMQKVAEACSGLSDQEKLIIDRVKEDLKDL